MRRPSGQLPGQDGPTYGPSRKLDIELEVGFFTGRATDLGTTISVDEAHDYIAASCW